MNSMAEKHFTKARGYLVKGDEMYRKAAAEIRAGMKADPSLTQEEIGRWFGHSQSWVQRLLAWDKDYSSTNNPTPFVRPANKTANDTKAFLRDAPMEVVERVLDDLPKEDDGGGRGVPNACRARATLASSSRRRRHFLEFRLLAQAVRMRSHSHTVPPRGRAKFQ